MTFAGEAAQGWRFGATFSTFDHWRRIMPMKKLLALIFAIALLCSSGCSTMRFSYDHADMYLRYKINGYTSFNAQQKDEIRREVAAYMIWHRKNALPEYISFLQNIFGVIQPNHLLKKEDITLLRGEYNKLYRKSLEPGIRPAARMLSALDSRQTEELVKTLAKKVRTLREEKLFESDQKNHVMRSERNIDFVSKLVGRLNGKQEEQILELSIKMPFAAKQYIEFREDNQKKLIALINGKAGEEKIAAFLGSWINTPDATRTPQQQQAIQNYESSMDEMTVQIYGLLTDRQKERLRKEVLKYIEDFQYLNAEKVTAGASSRQEARAAETR